jgi:hypothetical protein
VIPPFRRDGNLPPGIHHANWADFWQRYGTNTKRLALLGGLRMALVNLSGAGCIRAYIDGSFVSSKEFPGDYDGCWDPEGVDPDLLDPILLKFDDHRFAMKVKFGGELFPSTMNEGRTNSSFLEYFQRDTKADSEKGIVEILLETLV